MVVSLKRWGGGCWRLQAEVKIVVAPGKGDGNHSFSLGAWWGGCHFCFGLNFPSCVVGLSSSSLCVCLAEAWSGAWGPRLRVQTLEVKSTPLSGPQFPHSYCEGVFSTLSGSQFSHLKHCKWFHSVASFVPQNLFLQSLRF